MVKRVGGELCFSPVCLFCAIELYIIAISYRSTANQHRIIAKPCRSTANCFRTIAKGVTTLQIDLASLQNQFAALFHHLAMVRDMIT